MITTQDKLHQLYSCMHECSNQYLAYKATIARCMDTIEDDARAFLVMAANNSIQMYVINWCKIFGAKKNNPIHWSNYGVMEDIFYQTLLEKQGISREEFNDHRQKMMRFRNKFIAHTDGFNEPVPYLNIANAAIITLDGLLHGADKDIPFGTLEDYLEASKGMFEEIVERIIRL